MTAAKSIAKPGKPYPEYPLYAHRNGSWCKKHKGKHVSFGRWDEPQKALDAYLAWREQLEAGREPVRRIDRYSIADLVEDFIEGFTRQGLNLFAEELPDGPRRKSARLPLECHIPRVRGACVNLGYCKVHVELAIDDRADSLDFPHQLFELLGVQ